MIVRPRGDREEGHQCGRRGEPHLARDLLRHVHQVALVQFVDVLLKTGEFTSATSSASDVADVNRWRRLGEALLRGELAGGAERARGQPPCRWTWARITIDYSRRVALQCYMGHRVSTNVISV